MISTCAPEAKKRDVYKRQEAVAAEVGVDAVYAEVLPEDKAAFIRQEKAKGLSLIHISRCDLPLQQLEMVVTAIIHEIGVPAHIKGYQYLREGIILTVRNMEVINAVTKVLYPEIAKRFGTTPSLSLIHILWTGRP